MSDNMPGMLYNTQRSKMLIPEYGRNVQNMINFACTVADKEERNKVAGAIISVMGQLNPHLRDVDDYKHKLWAHLFVMSEFKLDVDSPYPIPTAETFTLKPDPMKYPSETIKYGHYGIIIEKLIVAARKYEAGEEKNFLILKIANLMKKSYLQWNRDSVRDEVISQQLKDMSEGDLVLEEGAQLTSTQELLKQFSVQKKSNNNNNRGRGGKGRSNHGGSNNNRNKKRY